MITQECVQGSFIAAKKNYHLPYGSYLIPYRSCIFDVIIFALPGVKKPRLGLGLRLGLARAKRVGIFLHTARFVQIWTQ